MSLLAGFRELVNYAETRERKGGSPDALQETLLAYCHSLRGEFDAMPRRTIAAINAVAAPRPELLNGASYAEGAAVVSAHIGQWRELFASRKGRR
jgi:hypothetical protein